MPTLKTLENLDIFKQLNDDELKEVQALCSEEEHQRGDKLFSEGEPAREMWIVIDGKVDLKFDMPNAKPVTDETTFSTHEHVINESQVFGWSCFIPPYKMRLSAYCVSRKCVVIKIGSSALNALMEKNTDIGYKIMRYMVQVVGFRSKQFQEEVIKFMGVELMNSW